MKACRRYRLLRYLFFWVSVIAYFVPYIAACSALLPFVVVRPAMKWGIGLAVAFINALPFVGGMLRKLLAHVPFINWLAICFLALAAFFTMEVFQSYVHTFLTIEAFAAAGSVLACLFWYFHKKYKRKAQTVKDVLKSGITGGGG